ncbi:MAG: OadG family protein [Bacteroidaceae bacterium]|nr:OadG family protein [Bacteroidaceae bacterium]
MSILVVFAILLILVAVLGIFTAVAKKTNAKVSNIKENRLVDKQVKTLDKSEDDTAAVAMALYLYLQEKENRESRVLTITPTPNSPWGAQLNPRY